MGITTMGIPREIVLELAQISSASTFVETGTYQGGTTKWAAGQFEVVHTIERAQVIYDQYGPDLDSFPNITRHLGDSKEVMPGIVETLGSQTVVHWLDGHWSGGPTAGEGDECPVREELNFLSKRPNDLILIDDARFFLCAPPKPHQPADWPTMGEIVNLLPDGGKQQFIQVVDDVIFIIPNEAKLKQALIAYSQKRTKVFWDEFAKQQKGPLNSLKKVAGSVRNRIVGE